MLKNIKTFTLGADPEFCCVNSKGTLIKASNWTSTTSRFGRDANEWVFELRPECSANPADIVKDIKTIFNDAVLNEPQYLQWKWISGSSHKKFPFGGHIHFGINKKIISAKDACSQFLDHYLGLITLLLEDKEQAIARRQYNITPGGNTVAYGRASDFREKPYGFEYRTPSSWISSPYIALGILSLAKTIMHEAINNPSFRFNYYVKPEDFLEIDRRKLKKAFYSAWRDIKKMSLYPKYSSDLNLLYYLIVKDKTWIPAGNNMRISWGIGCIASEMKYEKQKDTTFDYLLPQADENVVVKPKIVKPKVVKNKKPTFEEEMDVFKFVNKVKYTKKVDDYFGWDYIDNSEVKEPNCKYSHIPKTFKLTD